LVKGKKNNQGASVKDRKEERIAGQSSATPELKLPLRLRSTTPEKVWVGAQRAVPLEVTGLE
jgi:hypothetical protein